ncbi:MAG: hypothetical protein QM813_01110 [Verrucomicrobiota bacterium]
MIRKCTWHEFHLGQFERTTLIFLIPPGVEGDLAHGESGGKRPPSLIHHGVEAGLLRKHRRPTNPFVAKFVAGIGDVAHIKIGAPPQTVLLCLQGLVHQSARNFRRSTVEPGNEQ